MASKPQPTCFLDLCAAGAPLAAIARCLTCRDQLDLAHAVGKRYRDVALQEITKLYDVDLELASATGEQFRTLAGLLLRLKGVESVSPCQDEADEYYKVDAAGLTLLRLLPRLGALRLYNVNPEGDHVGICRSLAALETLESLDLSTFFDGANVDDGYSVVSECAEQLASLTKLTELRLAQFHLDAEAAQHIAGLHCLHTLDVSHNNLVGANLGTLTNLTYLNASEAAIDEVAMRHIGMLTGLRCLNLFQESGCNEHFDASCAAHLSSLVALTSLNLAHCDIGTEGTSALSRLSCLVTLNINGNEITGPGAAPLSLLTTLHTLICGANDFGPEGALHIGKCKSLRCLEIGNNHLGNAGSAQLTSLANLRHLSIYNNVLTADGAMSISTALTGLTYLAISHNDLGVAGAAHIARMTQLRDLHITNCSLPEDMASVHMLTSLCNLRKLYMFLDWYAMADGLQAHAALQKLFPHGCQIL